MAWSSNDEKAAEEAVKGWIGINEVDDPIGFKAWRDYRRIVFGCKFVPKNYTVPTAFPPATRSAAHEYAQALLLIRKAVKWNDKRSRIPPDPQPWGA